MRLKPASFKRDITVSIHASVKDATSKMIRKHLQIHVKIHESEKDATYAERHHTFDPVVSIHASVKDATSQLSSI